MKKIAYVITQSELGGAQKNVLLLCNGFKDKYDITVYSAPGGKMIDELNSIGIRHVAIPEMVREINPIMDFKCYKKLKMEFKKNKYDVVHSHSSKAGILAREAALSAGIKNIIYTAHGFVFNEPMSTAKKKLYSFLEAYESRKTTSLICVDENDISIAKNKGIKPKKNLVYVPNGIDFDRAITKMDSEFVKYQPSDKLDVNCPCIGKEKNSQTHISKMRRNFGISEEDFVFGSVANFYETKGHRYLIQAFKDMCTEGYEAKLLLIGDGHLLQEMKALAGDNKNIIFTGYVENAMDKMRIIDCFVMSSVKEGFPFVILEAIKNKIPIVSTDVGAIRKILNEEEFGILTQPNNVDSLRLSMIKAMEEYPMMIKKAEKSYECNKERYSLETMIKQTEELY